MEPSGCLIRDRNAFGWRGPGEASGVLLGVRAKTPRLSTWRLFVFSDFLLEIMMLRRAEPAFFSRAFQRHASLTAAPRRPNEERPGATSSEEVVTGPPGIRIRTRVNALEQDYPYQFGYASSTIYCDIGADIGHIWCRRKIVPRCRPIPSAGVLVRPALCELCRKLGPLCAPARAGEPAPAAAKES